MVKEMLRTLLPSSSSYLRPGSGASVSYRRSTASRTLLPWLLAGAYLTSAIATDLEPEYPQAVADNVYPQADLRGATRTSYVPHKFRIGMMVPIIATSGAIMYMFHNSNASTVYGPSWDPAGTVTYREWVREVTVWLNATSTRLTPTAQAAAIQLGLGGTARRYAMMIPSAAITFGASINGVHTDPVTYLLYVLGNRFEALEDERTMLSANLVLDFTARPREPIDSVLARFDMARHEAAGVGAEMTNYHNLTTILLRACRVSGDQMIHLLQPLQGRMPQNQAQYDGLVNRIRSMGHILERAPGNIMTGLRPPSSTTWMMEASTTDRTQTFLGEPTTEPPTLYDDLPPPPYYGAPPHYGGIFSGDPSAHGNVPSQVHQPLFTIDEDTGYHINGYDSGTNSDTASSCGDTPYDFTDLAHLAEEERPQELFWLQEHHKGRWR